MRFEEFKKSLLLPVFTSAQANQPLIQLSRWEKSGRLKRLKRGLYRFADNEIDEFSLAGYLYPQSYISLETALNNFGIIPDVSLNVTSVSPVTTKIIKTINGTYIYSKINQKLYFGWQKIKDNSGFYYQIALPEKALLDWVYVRRFISLEDLRLDLGDISKGKLRQFAKKFPKWVFRKIKPYLT